eukprot:scaffold7380_cov115-Isochrysis_galbana.AAC.6
MDMPCTKRPYARMLKDNPQQLHTACNIPFYLYTRKECVHPLSTLHPDRPDHKSQVGSKSGVCMLEPRTKSSAARRKTSTAAVIRCKVCAGSDGDQVTKSKE